MLHYLVTMADPKGHYFDVRLQLEVPYLAAVSKQNALVLNLSLPVWIPGSYLVREFARNVLYVKATVNGLSARCEKITKNQWQVQFKPSDFEGDQKIAKCVCEWRVYAWDLSVRGAHLDETHGFFNGTSLFLCPKGFEHLPIEVRIARPVGSFSNETWKVACGLPFEKNVEKDVHGCALLEVGSEVVFIASDYDCLIDHPVEMGDLQVGSFQACGVKHVFAVYGADTDLDLRRLCDDLKPVCEAQIALFEPVSQQAPFETYWFMLHATNSGYGGLEHRNSTSLLCSTVDLPQCNVEKAPEGYSNLLGLCSHEYFHAWNVKRIKPAAFTPYRLDEENYTSLLWIFEGFTSYYDDLMLARAGRLDEKAYLKALANNLVEVMKGPGHQIQSVAQASFDAWTKYYRQDENAPNSLVSYYSKGALIGLCLDAAIRQGTQGEKSLDDVMRLMWQTKGITGVGIQETEFANLVQQATGVALNEQIAQWTQFCDELPIAESLKTYGYGLERSAGEEAVYFGLQWQCRPEGMLVKHVFNGGPAHLAGVSAGDLLVSLGEKRITESNYKRTLAGAKPGQSFGVIGFRADRLMRFELVAAQLKSNKWLIEKLENFSGPILQAPWIQLSN